MESRNVLSSPYDSPFLGDEMESFNSQAPDLEWVGNELVTTFDFPVESYLDIYDLLSSRGGIATIIPDCDSSHITYPKNAARNEDTELLLFSMDQHPEISALTLKSLEVNPPQSVMYEATWYKRRDAAAAGEDTRSRRKGKFNKVGAEELIEADPILCKGVLSFELGTVGHGDYRLLKHFRQLRTETGFRPGDRSRRLHADKTLTEFFCRQDQMLKSRAHQLHHEAEIVSYDNGFGFA